MTTLERASDAAFDAIANGLRTRTVVCRALSAIRVDMDLMIRVGRELGIPPATVDLCWTRCIDAILEEEP